MRVRYIFAYTHTYIRAFFATRYSTCVDDDEMYDIGEMF